MDQDVQPLDAEDLLGFFERIDRLPPEDAAWVGRLFDECVRARTREAELMEGGGNGADASASEAQLAQVALDAAEWLRTLWNVGYMGSGSLPSQPRTEFPLVEMEDVLKSSLFARIREGKRPLPFPPPTRNGLPWHDLIEGAPESHVVNAEIVHDENGAAIGAIIEGCVDWLIVEDAGDGVGYVVQYRGKGPLFKLDINPFFSTLQRMPPQWERRIRVQERVGVHSYLLIWPSEGGGPPREIPLPAASWERAKSEAAYWVAKNRPEMYGRIRFEQELPAQ
jgi:hypothetical protein